MTQAGKEKSALAPVQATLKPQKGGKHARPEEEKKRNFSQGFFFFFFSFCFLFGLARFWRYTSHELHAFLPFSDNPFLRSLHTEMYDTMSGRCVWRCLMEMMDDVQFPFPGRSIEKSPSSSSTPLFFPSHEATIKTKRFMQGEPYTQQNIHTPHWVLYRRICNTLGTPPPARLHPCFLLAMLPLYVKGGERRYPPLHTSTHTHRLYLYLYRNPTCRDFPGISFSVFLLRSPMSQPGHWPIHRFTQVPLTQPLPFFTPFFLGVLLLFTTTRICMSFFSFLLMAMSRMRQIRVVAVFSLASLQFTSNVRVARRKGSR